MSAREQPRRPPRDLEVRVEATRCPYCHDAVRDAELQRARVCERCLSRHHRECWEERCASCQHPRALAAVIEQPARRGQATDRVLPIHVANLGYLACMVLAVMTVPLAFANGPPSDDAPPMLFLSLSGIATGFSLGMWALNTIHAVRTQASSSARGLALLSPCTGGMSGLVYYLVYVGPPWPTQGGGAGRRPGVDDEAPPPAPKSDAKSEPDATSKPAPPDPS